MIIDLHTHVLPGVDDGPAALAESLDLVAAAARAGVDVVVATPHVRDDYPTRASTMEQLVAELASHAAADGLPPRILPGGEIAVERLVALRSTELRRFGLGGTTSLLVEFPYHGWPPGLADHLSAARERGFRPILAHPERNEQVQSGPGRLASLVESGVLVQITASSLSRGFGRAAQKTALRLLELGLAHIVASDTHGPPRPSFGFADARAALRDERLFRWLTNTVPAAVLEDAEIPPRPQGRRRRPWLRR